MCSSDLSDLERMFSEPEFLALLQAAPQAGRIVRPLCRALGIPLPQILQLPQRPRREKPPRARKPRPEKPYRQNPIRRPPKNPEPGEVWRKWRGLWMPEPIRKPDFP